MSSNQKPTGSHSYTIKNKTTNLKNKQLSPLIITKTLINQTGSHSPSDFSDNENDWQTVTNESGKRQRSPNTLSSPLPKKDTSIFISSNRFSPLAPPNEESQMDTNNIEQPQEVTPPKTVNPPPIFIESNLNFNNFTAKIKELTQPVGFESNHPDDSAHAGAALLISTKIPHSPFHPKSNQHMQIVATSININSIPTSIASAYFPPGSPFPAEDLSLFLQTLNHTYIIGADFNAKHEA
ncbi:hypothetical protein QTP88_026443 [Uroleucon formosanum]